jgi:hypothetical protein
LGLSSWIKKTLLTESPEKKVKRKLEREHKTKVNEAYLKAFYKAELEAASEQGKLAGKNAKVNSKNNGLLATIGRIAEGTMKGVNQGADMFNQGMGAGGFDLKEKSNEIVLPKNDELYIPKGNNNLFFEEEPKPKKRHYDRDW